MNSELKKSLVDLIDETLGELEELKKSRFSAAEIKLEGPGADGIDGKPANGSLGKEEDKKEDEDEKDEDKEDKDMDKAEGKNSEADPNAGHHKPADSMDKAEGKNSEADPNAGHHKPADMSKKEDDEDEDDKEDKKEEMKKSSEKAFEEELKKSREEMTSLMKSFVDERIQPLEDKLSTIVDLVNKLADQPVAPKGVTARAIPLMKSADSDVEPLSKSEISNKLFELKKSGTHVDSLDVAKAEMGQDLEQIVKKYQIS